MKIIKLSDIFDGDYKITQYFGANPEYYGQFGLAGHEGVDWGCPNGTSLLCPFDEAVIVRAADYGNYGKHIVLWDAEQQAGAWFCHCQELFKKVGDVVNRGTPIALSNNTGNSSGPHLHFSICRTDSNGVRINQDNGYIGMLNPLDSDIVEWQLSGSKEDRMVDSTTMQIEKTKFEELVTKATERDEWVEKMPMDNPEKVLTYISDLRESIKGKNEEIRIAEERAEDWKRDYREIISIVAKALDTTQDRAEVIAEAKKVSDKLDKYADLRREHDSLKENKAEMETELKSEIARLKALIKQENQLEAYDTVELIREVLKRIIKILPRS